MDPKRKNHPHEKVKNEWIAEKATSGSIRSITAAAAAIVLIVLLLWCGFQSFYWYFNKGNTPVLSDPNLQKTIPTQAATVTAATGTRNFWTDQQWLDQSAARQLRTQQNVINLAYIQGNGGVRYSSNLSVIFTEGKPWETSFPRTLETSALSTRGTQVKMTINQKDYTLNMLQPFVINTQDQMVFIVDLSGQLWRARVSDLSFTTPEKAAQKLPQSISANSNLSLTFSER